MQMTQRTNRLINAESLYSLPQFIEKKGDLMDALNLTRKMSGF